MYTSHDYIDESIDCAREQAGIATTMTQPLDVMKTRLMNAAPGDYASIFDCLRKTLADGGPLALYKVRVALKAHTTCCTRAGLCAGIRASRAANRANVALLGAITS